MHRPGRINCNVATLWQNRAILIASPTWAADCNVKLGPRDGFKELSAKLACMNAKIKKLEQLIRGSASAGAVHKVKVSAATGARSITKGGITIYLKRCRKDKSNSKNITCVYEITNVGKTDKEVCFHNESRLITDKGTAWSGAKYQSVGSKENYRSGQACDVVPSQIKVNGYLVFEGATASTEKSFQLVRLNCGSGCTLSAYNVPFE